MKLNRLTSVIAFALALLVVIGQFVGSGVQAAPASNHVSAVSAQFNADSGAAKGSASVSKPSSPADQTPYHLTVQGRLTDPSGNPITVATNMTFKLYTAASGGSPLYTEGPVSVTPSSNGLFTYLLGSNASWTSVTSQLFANKVYLGITVASDAEMSPRFEMTGSPYAYSLAPGAEIAGATANGTSPAILNVTAIGGSASNTVAGFFGNTSGGSGSRTGISVAVGGIGSVGTSSSSAASFNNEGGGSGTGGHYGIQSTLQGAVSDSGYGGFFQDLTFNTTSPQYGLFSLAYSGEGLHAISDSATNSQQSAGVVGVSFDTNGYGGVFTGTTGIVSKATNTTSSGYAGIHAYGATGVWGTAQSTGSSAGYGAYFWNYGGGSGTQYGTFSYAPNYAGYFSTPSNTNTGAYVYGNVDAHAYLSHASFGMVVKYNGSAPLHSGDVLALDGNNEVIDGQPTLGVVKADAGNFGAAIGVAQYRMAKGAAPQMLEKGASSPIQNTWTVDDKATTYQQGDLVTLVVVGQVQMKVAGNVKIGDHLTITDDGSVAQAKDSADTIGKVASKPDANGFVTVFVNFK